MCAHGHVRRSTVTVSSGRQAGITPNLLITHLWKIAPPPIVLHEPCPLTAAKNSMPILKELKCVLCSNILSQPLELACSSLVCTKCIVDMIAASGSLNCPFCSDDGPLKGSISYQTSIECYTSAAIRSFGSLHKLWSGCYSCRI